MSEFKFALSQRVTIKTEDLGVVEGVVSGQKAMLNSEHEYDVHYLLPDLKLQHIVVLESALAAMQPAKDTLVVKVDVDQTHIDEALGKARELNVLVDRASGRRRSRR